MSVQTLSRKPESCETMRQVISVLETRYLSSQATCGRISEWKISRWTREAEQPAAQRRRTQMVSRLVEQEDVGSDEHGSGELKLHLPSSGERSDRVRLLLVDETGLSEGFGDLRLLDLGEFRVCVED
jgi:hypothetical protein